MIVNFDSSVIGVLNKDLFSISSSDHKFALTGSRFFGGYDEKSDWDFFIKNNSDVRLFLEELGFQEEKFTGYTDELTVMVVRKYYCSCKFSDNQHSDDCQHIDIQLVSDFELKEKASKILRRNFRGKLPGDKDDRKSLWDLAIDLAKATINHPVKPKTNWDEI
jgi:hypothetical protein